MCFFRLFTSHRYSNGSENCERRIDRRKLSIKIRFFERCSHDIHEFTALQHKSTIKGKFIHIAFLMHLFGKKIRKTFTFSQMDLMRN